MSENLSVCIDVQIVVHVYLYDVICVKVAHSLQRSIFQGYQMDYINPMTTIF